MKILLLYPGYDRKTEFGKFEGLARSCMPLGLALLGAILREKKYDVYCIDTTVDYTSDDELKEKLKQDNPDIVGVSILSPMIDAARKKIKLIRETLPKAKVIAGGAHITYYPKDAFEHFPGIDLAFFGEAERSFPRLLEELKKEKPDLSKVKGIIYRKGGKVVQNDPEPFIENLDELPMPARDMFPVLKYKPSVTRYKQLPSTSMYVSRGCPFRCAFCTQTFGKKVRVRSAEKIFEEMMECYNRWGIRDFEFFDDSIAIHRPNLIRLCSLLIESKIKFTWSCQMRVVQTDEKILAMMKKAGCWNIRFGLESGVQRLLDYITKDQTIGQMTDAVNLCDKVGIIAYGGFIIGLPTETAEESWQTISYALSLPLSHCNFAIYEPRPNTRLFRMAQDEGFEIEDVAYSSLWSGLRGTIPKYAPKGRSPEELAKLQRTAFKRFYMRPSFALRHLKRIRSWQDLKTSFVGLRFLLGLGRGAEF